MLTDPDSAKTALDRIVIPQDALDRIFDGIICSALSADLSEDQADMLQRLWELWVRGRLKKVFRLQSEIWPAPSAQAIERTNLCDNLRAHHGALSNRILAATIG